MYLSILFFCWFQILNERFTSSAEWNLKFIKLLVVDYTHFPTYYLFPASLLKIIYTRELTPITLYRSLPVKSFPLLPFPFNPTVIHRDWKMNASQRRVLVSAILGLLLFCVSIFLIFMPAKPRKCMLIFLRPNKLHKNYCILC